MSVYVRPGVGKGIPVPIPGLEKVSPNPKNFQIHSQSFQNSIPIPKFEPETNHPGRTKMRNEYFRIFTVSI